MGLKNLGWLETIGWSGTVMNLLAIFSRYPDQEACIEHIEQVRWGDDPCCTHCGSVDVARKADGKRLGRWNCHDCKSSFNALSGTVFQKTKVPLQKWFLAIGLVVNAKNSISSCQLAQDLELTQPTAWYLLHRLRAAMMTDQAELLQDVIEADETYEGGKSGRGNRRKHDKPSLRGRGTSKVAVIGAVERGGKFAAAVATNLTGKGIVEFIKSTVEPKESLLITDEYGAYNAIRKMLPHAVINHTNAYVDGDTNTIEGFWALLEQAWYGQHHHYKTRYMSFYVREACWKYNNRSNGNAFGGFMRECFAP